MSEVESRAERAGAEAFTWSALAGIGGASTAVTMVAGTLSSAFDWHYPKWLPLVLSLVVVVAADASTRKATRMHEFKSPGRWLLWLLNSCLVFMTAIGGSRLVVPAEAAEATPDSASSAGAAEPTEAAPAPPSPTPPAETREVAPAPATTPAPVPGPGVTERGAGASARVARPRTAVPAESASVAAAAAAPSSGTPAESPRPSAVAIEPRPTTSVATARPAPTPAKPVPREAGGFRRLGDISLF